MDLLIFHKDCVDGWCSAFVASKKYPEARLVPRDHGLEPPYEIVKDQNVLVMDFSWRTRAENDKLAQLAKSFQILDHHKSAQEVLNGAPYAIFDMHRSGAGLTWDTLFKEKRPWYVDYVEDRDLWRFVLPQSKEVNAYLTTLEHTKEVWDTLEGLTFQTAATLGEGALRHVEHYVREAVKQAQFGRIASHETAVLNVPYLNCSEVGHDLADKVGISLTWFERGDGFMQFSLRGNGTYDMSEIAKLYGGGGHHNAAGFQVPLAEGRKILDKILGRE